MLFKRNKSGVKLAPPLLFSVSEMELRALATPRELVGAEEEASRIHSACIFIIYCANLHAPCFQLMKPMTPSLGQHVGGVFPQGHVYVIP